MGNISREDKKNSNIRLSSSVINNLYNKEVKEIAKELDLPLDVVRRALAFYFKSIYQHAQNNVDAVVVIKGLLTLFRPDISEQEIKYRNTHGLKPKKR